MDKLKFKSENDFKIITRMANNLANGKSYSVDVKNKVLMVEEK